MLNQILRQTQTPLSDGPFSVLVDHMKLLDFDVKNRYFRAELQKLDEGKIYHNYVSDCRLSFVYSTWNKCGETEETLF